MLRFALTASLLLALAATGAPALAGETVIRPAGTETDLSPTILPVWSQGSGRIEALLLLEPAQRSTLERVIGGDEPLPNLGLGTRLRLEGGGNLDALLKLEPSRGLALLCEGSGLASSLGALAQHCLVASLERNEDPLLAAASGRRAEARYDLPGGRFELSFGLGRYDVGSATGLSSGASAAAMPPQFAPVQAWQTGPAPFLGEGLAGLRLDVQDIGLTSRLDVSGDGWVAIGGSYSRARLVPATEAIGLGFGLPGTQRWDSTELTIGGGIGAFSGAVTGRVVDMSGREGSWGGIDLGLTWRTPWQARLTVGAHNFMTRGKNPWTGLEEEAEEGQSRVPYVRYQQDL